MSVAAETFDRLYTSGDLLLSNPVEWCIIFVCVILVSAALEYIVALIRASIRNKYASRLTNVAVQEICIVGAICLLLMVATSLIPEDYVQVYPKIFTWITMCLFLMLILYVAEVIAGHLFSSRDMFQWRIFEEGRMDSDDVSQFYFRERHYRLAHDRFAQELKLVTRLTPNKCPFHQMIGIFHRRYTAKLGDLSFRVWLGVGIIVLSNFGRCMFSPYTASEVLFRNQLDDSEQAHRAIVNTVIFLSMTGWLVLFLHILFCLWLFRNMSQLLNGELRRSTIGAEIVPFGNPVRSIEFLQVVFVSINYYMATFLFGIASTVKATGYTFAVVAVCCTPVIVVLCTVPWITWSLSIMTVLGSLRRNKLLVQRVVRQARGEFADNSDDEDEEYDDLDDQTDHRDGQDALLEKVERQVGRGPSKNQRQLQPGEAMEEERKRTTRPIWLDDDEPWDGVLDMDDDDENPQQTVATIMNEEEVLASGIGTGGMELNFFVDNVEEEDLMRAARRVAPELVELENDERMDQERQSALQLQMKQSMVNPSGPKARPIWLESDEETPDL